MQCSPEPNVVGRPVRVVRRRTATATQTAMGGPPPRLVIAPHLLCTMKDLALRSTRRPLSNHPNEPLAPVKEVGSIRMKSLSIVAMMLVLVGGCSPPEVEQISDTEPVGQVKLDDEAWTAALLEERQEIDVEFKTSEESPMAGSQYLKSEPMDEVYLVLRDGVFELADSPPMDGTEVGVVKQDEAWHVQSLGQDVVGQVGEEAVVVGAALEGPASFDIGELHLNFYPSEHRVTFIVFDPERPEMTSFEHLLYFPPDRNFAVDAKMVVLPEPEKLEIPTTRNLIKTFYRYATIEFEVDGEQQELTALKSELTGEGSEGLFIAFRDATTGRETYGAGRYLEIDDPENESFVLDFNRAFNPLCNYSDAYNCTLPPRENHLEVAIRAGEKTYPH